LCAFTCTNSFAKVVEKAESYKDFTGISIACNGNVYLKQGNKDTVKIKCDEELLPKLDIYVENNVLYIMRKDKSDSFFSDFFGSKKLNVYVTMKEIDRLSASASGNINVDGNIKSQSLNLSASSGGDLQLEDISTDSVSINTSSAGEVELGKLTVKSDVELETSSSGEIRIDTLNAQKLYGNASSSGEIEISDGSVDRINVKASSSGEFDLRNLKSKKGEAAASSGGDVTVTITEEASINASSGGDVYLYGNPKMKYMSTNSGGNVKIR
jgi:hypothetical protein